MDAPTPTILPESDCPKPNQQQHDSPLQPIESIDQTRNPPLPVKIHKIDIPKTTKTLNIAIVGCVHGELDLMYQTCEEYQQKTKQTIHIILCCGDFESLRNHQDLQCLAAPPKYREMVDFYTYYNGKKTAPILTLFTHGNHEASNYLMELPYGGWVAPNIYYMGFTNVISFYGTTIAAIGGICKHSYHLPRNEVCPLNSDSMRTLYHTREVDTWMIKQYEKPIDMMLSHDWPSIAPQYGDLPSLLSVKPAFETDIRSNSLGSRHHTSILQTLRPLYWFSAHLHCKYSAVIPHNLESITNANKNNINSQITPPLNFHPTSSPSSTKFLALDKILPYREFIQIIPHPIGSSSIDQEVIAHIDSQIDLSSILNNFLYDPYWIQILKQSQPLYPRSPTEPFSVFKPINYSLETHKDYYQQFSGALCPCITESSSHDDLFYPPNELQVLLYPNSPLRSGSTSFHDMFTIPSFSFAQTAAPLYEQQRRIHLSHKNGQLAPHQFIKATIPDFFLNPQTILFCNLFQLLVPLFSPQYQWCSPKHAAKLYNERK